MAASDNWHAMRSEKKQETTAATAITGSTQTCWFKEPDDKKKKLTDKDIKDMAKNSILPEDKPKRKKSVADVKKLWENMEGAVDGIKRFNEDWCEVDEGEPKDEHEIAID